MDRSAFLRRSIDNTASVDPNFLEPDLTGQFVPNPMCWRGEPLKTTQDILHNESAAGKRFLRQLINKPPEPAQTRLLGHSR
jgi:hypothetical protein